MNGTALLLVLLGLATVAWLGLRPRCDFQIRSNGDMVVATGKLSQSQRTQIVRFFMDDLAVSDFIRVRGTRSRDGRLHLTFRGADPGMQQQIRNFLHTLL